MLTDALKYILTSLYVIKVKKLNNRYTATMTNTLQYTLTSLLPQKNTQIATIWCSCHVAHFSCMYRGILEPLGEDE